MSKPGECHDRRGVPIYPGDLIRSPHFRTKRKRYWLYHTAVLRGDTMQMVPTSDLEPTQAGQGGVCLLTQDLVADSEVISGYGPGACEYFDDRKRVRP